MNTALFRTNRFLITLAVVFSLLASACSREEVCAPADEPAGTDRSMGQDANDILDNSERPAGTTLRGGEFDQGGSPDDDGISDDGNDEGDSERNKKNKTI
jgi:hypothetical protein